MSRRKLGDSPFGMEILPFAAPIQRFTGIGLEL